MSTKRTNIRINEAGRARRMRELAQQKKPAPVPADAPAKEPAKEAPYERLLRKLREDQKAG